MGNKVKDIEIPVATKNEINHTFNRNGITGGMYIYRIRNNGAILHEGKLLSNDQYLSGNR